MFTRCAPTKITKDTKDAFYIQNLSDQTVAQDHIVPGYSQLCNQTYGQLLRNEILGRSISSHLEPLSSMKNYFFFFHFNTTKETEGALTVCFHTSKTDKAG